LGHSSNLHRLLAGAERPKGLPYDGRQMSGSARRRSGNLAEVVADALVHPPMRRLQVASAAWSAGEAAYLVGLFVYAYSIGGPASVAAIAVLRTLPSVVLAPVLTLVTRARSAESLLRAILVLRVGCVAVTAVGLAMNAPIFLGYALVAVDAVAATLLRPIRGSLLPAIARSPEELVAGNVALTTGDSLANLVGPGLAAAMLVSGDAVATFIPGITLLLLALFAGLGVRGADASVVRSRSGGSSAERPPESGPSAAWRSAGPALPVIAAFTAQRFVRGALTVLLVAAALDLLGMGDAGVGLLTAALGLGGIVGGIVAVGLIGRRHLAPWFALGIGVWSIPFIVINAIPVPAVALVLLGLGGIGKVMIDVAGSTLLQRAVPHEARVRVLGLQEGLVTGALAAGALVAALVIENAGIQAALLGAGIVPLVAIAGLWALLRGVDARARGHDAELDLLELVPLFRPLQLAVKEELAAELDRVTVPGGVVIVRQGDLGDRFFIIDSGTVEVEIAGERSRQLTRGDAFGEIALLRDVPRTATVRSVTEARLATLDRNPFLAAVTGHRESAVLADELIEERLGG
jgi:hypothetical protein